MRDFLDEFQSLCKRYDITPAVLLYSSGSALLSIGVSCGPAEAAAVDVILSKLHASVGDWNVEVNAAYRAAMERAT